MTIKNSALLCILALSLTLQACGGGGGSVGGVTDGGATDGGSSDGGSSDGGSSDGGSSDGGSTDSGSTDGSSTAVGAVEMIEDLVVQYMMRLLLPIHSHPDQSHGLASLT